MASPHDVYSGIGETISTLADDEDVEHSSRSSLMFPEYYEHTEDDIAECQQEICDGKSGSNEAVVPENKDAESRSSLRELAVPPPSLKVRCLNVKACGVFATS